MSRERFIDIARETNDIILKGRYTNSAGKTVQFDTEGENSVFEVKLFSPEVTDEMLDREADIMAKAKGDGCRITVIDSDSLEAAKGLSRPLVMNFANAHRAGGGYLNGARGCGAFANDPYDVAEYFRFLLKDEGYGEMFDRIVFAVYGKGENLRAFKETFEEDEE